MKNTKFKTNDLVKLSNCPFDEQILSELQKYITLKNKSQKITHTKKSGSGTSGQWIKTNLIPDWTDAAWFKISTKKLSK